MNSIKKITTLGTLDDIASLLVGVMFGWKAEQPTEREEEMPGTPPSALDYVMFVHGNYYQLTVAQLRQIASGYNIKGCWKMRKAELVKELDSIPAKDTDLDNFTIKEVPDYEVEHTFLAEDEFGFPVLMTDDNTNCSMPWWTRSGDTPVIKSETQQASDARSAGGFSDIKQDYVPSHYSVSKWGSGKRQTRLFHKWLTFIIRNKDDKRKLRDGWNKFWRRWYAKKHKFMFWAQVQCIVSEFKKCGITARKRHN